ncbi:MAG: SH3 domain-containing protein [Cyanobacteria bacterium J06648_11]
MTDSSNMSIATDSALEATSDAVSVQRRRRRTSRVISTWLTLLCLGVLAGAIAGLGWKVWQFVRPLTETPPLPTFAREVRDRDAPKAEQLARQSATAPAAIDPSTQRAPEPLDARPDVIPASLPDGTQARVVEPIGLLIKAEPSYESETISGVGMNETVVVLELSADEVWQRIRLDQTGEEGWVKAQNLLPL